MIVGRAGAIAAATARRNAQNQSRTQQQARSNLQSHSTN